LPKITDYKPLPKNPNKGTQRGIGVLDESVRKLGAGRSILVDKNGVIIAGNHAQEAFINAGMDEVIEVETDGNQIVVVKRTDMDADSTQGKKMALMDNRAGELGLAWDDVIVEEILQDIQEQDGELDYILQGLADDENIDLDEKEIPEKNVIVKPKEMARVLVSVPIDNAMDAKEILDQLESIPGIEIIYGAN